MSITSDSTTITFGQSNETMKYVHSFFKAKGIQNVSWDEYKFDENTVLSLLLLNNSCKCVEYVNDGGPNSEPERYKEGSTVIINSNSKYYSSPNSKEPAGIISNPTTGILKTNSLLQPNAPLNPLKISLMNSPLNSSLGKKSEVKNLTGDTNDSSVLAKTTNPVDKNSKQYGGYTQSEIVYLRADSVIPSFSDVLIGSELSKIMKAGEISSKGIELINSVNTINKDSKEFLDDSSNSLNNFLNKDKERQKEQELKNKSYEELLKNLNKETKKIDQQTFNKNGMFIKNLITDTVIYIPFRPDSVSDSYTISWSEQNTRGSSHTAYGYEMTTGSSPNITFDFDVGALAYYLTRKRERVRMINRETGGLIEDIPTYEKNLILKRKNQSLTQELDEYEEIFQIVTSYLNSLKALAYPLYTNGLVTPPSCYVSIARTFRFVGVCTAVNIDHKGPLYVKPQGKDVDGSFIANSDKAGDQMFMNYSVTLNFNKIVNQDFSADTVEVYGDNWTGGQSDSEN